MKLCSLVESVDEFNHFGIKQCRCCIQSNSALSYTLLVFFSFTVTLDESIFLSLFAFAVKVCFVFFIKSYIKHLIGSSD